jgi:hypothetical protein
MTRMSAILLGLGSVTAGALSSEFVVCARVQASGGFILSTNHYAGIFIRKMGASVSDGVI